MNTAELRDTLSNEAAIEDRPFAVLQALSAHVNQDANTRASREFVLRALEYRSSFEGFEPILDALTREVGLFPYLNPGDLDFKDLLAYEFHTPETAEGDFVFHRAQAEVYRRLHAGENVILSAPTSFGKSRIIDAIIGEGHHDNIVVIVPTIALIDETRRRFATFGGSYKIVSQLSQPPADKNIFVFTAERAIAYDDLPNVDFFVIDEFYKIGALAEDETRTIALNQAFYRLLKGGGQFYLLGPSIERIPDGLEENFRCYFFATDFNTVVSEVVPVFDWTDELERVAHLAQDLHEPTLIYCKSPRRVNDVANALLEAGVCESHDHLTSSSEWVAENFHPDWVYSKAIRHGIGMHHGRLPRSLGQFSVKAFNDGRLRFLICTSTLIEGVNTKAKNVVILDNRIAMKKFDFFTFNNIRGRSGRMGKHFVGRVFLFHEPPTAELPFVDFPLFTQDNATPESLLVQIEEDDLREEPKNRLKDVFAQDLLPIDVIKANSGLDPRAQIALAETIYGYSEPQLEMLQWKQFPKWEELVFACELFWKAFIGSGGKGGVFSGKQLAFKTAQLRSTPGVKERIAAELQQKGKYAPKSADEAVERVLEFDRTWAGFQLPRYLMALSRVQEHVLNELGNTPGDYSFFSAQLEALFRNPVVITLEEFGLPIQIGERISKEVDLGEDLDQALQRIREIPTEAVVKDEFEFELLQELQIHI